MKDQNKNAWIWEIAGKIALVLIVWLCLMLIFFWKHIMAAWNYVQGITAPG
jgi:hypothetical protein